MTGPFGFSSVLFFIPKLKLFYTLVIFKEKEAVLKTLVKGFIKNIFEVNINRNNDLLVEGEIMVIDDLKEAAVKFIDNGGGDGKPGEDGTPGLPCAYCEGERSPSSSDHPNKAIISVQSDRGTEYGTYIEVQNELLKAYTILRNRLSQQRYGILYTELEKRYKDSRGSDKEELKKKVEDIKTSFPQIISDAEPTSAN